MCERVVKYTSIDSNTSTFAFRGNSLTTVSNSARVFLASNSHYEIRGLNFVATCFYKAQLKL